MQIIRGLIAMKHELESHNDPDLIKNKFSDIWYLWINVCSLKETLAYEMRYSKLPRFIDSNNDVTNLFLRSATSMSSETLSYLIAVIYGQLSTTYQEFADWVFASTDGNT